MDGEIYEFMGGEGRKDGMMSVRRGRRRVEGRERGRIMVGAALRRVTCTYARAREGGREM